MAVAIFEIEKGIDDTKVNIKISEGTLGNLAAQHLNADQLCDAADIAIRHNKITEREWLDTLMDRYGDSIVEKYSISLKEKLKDYE